MSIWNIFSLLGGLALFLFGMIEMNKHLTSIAGSSIKGVMLTLTKGRMRGYFTGLGITMINQSSSATTVLEAALVGAGLMTFQQSLAVTLGAELGSTFLPQLVAFPSITKFSTLIVTIGFIVTLIVKTNRGRHIGMTILTFGFLFLGMDMMSSALTPLRFYEPFIELMKNIETPILGILLGLVFTMIIQSSGATTGITIAMALAGTISLEQAVPINLGAAVGTCITAVLGSIALNWEAKRAAYIHILFQFIGVIWVFILLMIPFQGERLYIWMVKWFAWNVLKTDNIARQIAMAFTFMPVINHLIIFPNLNHVVRFFNIFFPEREKLKPFGPKYLGNESVTEGVEESFIVAKKEIIRVASFVELMIDETIAAFRSKNPDILERISMTDSKVDILHKAIMEFLAKLSQQKLSPEESEVCMNLMYIQNELESIGDVIDKNILGLAAKKIEQNLIFSDEGFHELEHLLFKMKKNFHKLELALSGEKPNQAAKLVKAYKDHEEEKYKKKHLYRLHQGFEQSMATSAVHMDLISYFARINGHIFYIANRLTEDTYFSLVESTEDE